MSLNLIGGLVTQTSLKLGKSAGPDGIPPDVVKCCDFDDICLNFCNKVLMQCDKPPQWSFMNIIPVPKSADLSVTDKLTTTEASA